MFVELEVKLPVPVEAPAPVANQVPAGAPAPVAMISPQEVEFRAKLKELRDHLVKTEG